MHNKPSLFRLIITGLGLLFTNNIIHAQNLDSGFVRIPMMDNTAIAGELLTSDGAKNLVIIVPGMMNADMDGNTKNSHTDTYKALALGLMESNVASFRYDRRGIGKSKQNSRLAKPVTMDVYIRDLRELVDNLNTTYNFQNIYLLGHGEGALVSSAVASEIQIGGLIYAEGPATTMDSIMMRKLEGMELNLDVPKLMDSVRMGKEIRQVPEMLEPLIGTEQQVYLRSTLNHDPRNYLKNIKCPALLAYGDMGSTNNEKTGKTLAQGCSNCDLQFFSGMSYTLKRVNTQEESDQSLTRNSYPVHEKFLKAVVEFTKK